LTSAVAAKEAEVMAPSETVHTTHLEKFIRDKENVSTQLESLRDNLDNKREAIAKLAKSTESGLGATMFITHAPCMDCAKLIFQSGISHVLYRNSYRNTAGVDFLEKGGIQVQQLKEEEP
jgi:deoxycytidylate deaminase